MQADVLRKLGLGLWCLALLASHGGADAQVIRLRAGAIVTPDPTLSRVLPKTTEAPVFGLYLIQFTNRIERAWRETLATRDNQVIHYVPDDTLVVRLNGDRLGALRALPFVRWIGPFEPRHKLDPRLMAAFAKDLRANLPVKLLVAPGSTGVQLAAVLRSLRNPTRRQAFSLGTTFQGTATVTQLRALAQSESVLWIEPVSRMRLFDEVATKIVGGDTAVSGSLARVQELGYDGTGVTVAVADSGLDSGALTEMHPDVAGRVDGLVAYDNLPDASDEHSHGTHVAGIIAGNAATGEVDDNGQLWGLGVAPGAHLVIERIFDGTGDYRPPPSYERLTQDAVRRGAYIGSNSWGDDTAGQYDLSAAEFDALVRDADSEVPGEQAYVLEFSAGNSGPAQQSIGSPAVAKNVIATGATDNDRYEFPLYGEGQEVMADFSARGPAEDGRIKPDIVAPGTWISSMRSVFANDNNSWGPISDRYLYMGGTSQAGPHASGAAAVAVQWYRATHAGVTPSPALVKAMLINSADDMGTAEIPDTGGILGGEDDTGGSIVVGGTDPVPNQDEGWGRINLLNLIESSRRFVFKDQSAGLITGEAAEQRVIVGGDDPLKITLVYSDAPGLPAAIPALVNDLDLEVVAPNGDIYRGNAFTEGESVPGTPEGDRINNVEAVHLSSPAAGEWTLRVRARNVVQDVHKRPTGRIEQDFAWVISGQLPAPGEGVVSWDREAYSVPTTATIRLVDAQLAGQPTVSVTVRSSTETNGFAINLAAVGANGSFQGTVDLVRGTVVSADGRLSANDGDELAVVYRDLNPAGDRLAKATVDGNPPLVSDVQSPTQFGRVAITWTTSEPASSTVFFGGTNAVTNQVSVAGLTEQHRADLPELVVGQTYYFFVVSADAAGNTTTNLLDGRFYYRFVAPRPVAALLVYSPEALFAEGGILGDTPYPGLETWTAPLDTLGISYEVWDTSVVGRAPTAAELNPYRVVLWRPEELQGILPGMASALTSYVQTGGALFAASFDLLTRLTEVVGNSNFVAQVLHVESFVADGGASEINGIAGDPVGGGLAASLDYEAFPSGLFIDLLGISWPDGPDYLTPATNAAAVFLQEDQRVVGVRFPRTGEDSRGRVVFLSFALEAVPADQPAPNNRATVLANALRFLTPELVGGSTVAFDQLAYTVPGNVVVEATDSQRAGQGQVGVALVNGVTRQTLSLTETPRRGVFRGRFTLLPPPAPAGTGTFPAQDGDTMRASYIDGANREVSVEARVDTQKAVISGVASEPAYNEAVITWSTDKAADALVRFGESGGDDSFLTRSAYTAELNTAHEVQLVGLLPDKTYYFQVVSRDDAGNLTIDNHGGDLYTVRTLKPLSTPWTDLLDQNQAGWAVYDDSGQTSALFPGDDETGGLLTGSIWQFGVPATALGLTAHTGTNVWATNLEADNVDFAITDLITPAISLVGGSKASLHFWQAYDFTSSADSEDDPFADFALEAGQVALSTDNGTTWKDLYSTQAESSEGWEEVVVDISKYAGSVVRFRFNYQLFTFNPSQRTGWLLDDVGVELTAVPITEVQVRNNLAQAAFAVSGPGGIAFTGFGTQFRTNVSLGEYRVTWTAIPFYLTPAPQTNTLTSAGPLVFQGIYTFPDTNQNGISDLWEQRFFGNVANVHPATSDTDGDGANDGQEFFAGTDPNDAQSRLALTGPVEQPNHTLRFAWAGAVGREYQLEVSNDLFAWLAVGEPQRGSGGTLEATLPALDPRLGYFFRLRLNP